MTTIVKRAQEYALQFEERYQVAMFKAYIAGATEQKQIDIDKSCEWLEASLFPTVKTNFDNVIGVESTQDFIEKFRKAMKGE